MRTKGFVFGDIHFPFHHRVLLPVAIWFCVKHKPDYCLQVGDLYDWLSASKFPRSYNVMTPRSEQEHARYYGELFWMCLNEFLPDAKKYQLLGNHCVRPLKRMIEKFPESECMVVDKLQELYTFPNVKTVFDTREELIIDDVWFHHGHFSKLGAHAEYNHNNTVVGHSHRGGTMFFPLNGHAQKQIWEGNAGYLADPFSPGLSYTMQKRATRWTHGYMIVDWEGPKFIPIHEGMATWLKDDKLFKAILDFFK